jgi:hypothetical protein
MKLSGRTTRTTVIEGELDVVELSAYVRQTLNIPEDVKLRFYAGEPPHDTDLNAGVPLRFNLVLQTEDPLPPPALTTPPA